MSFPGAIGSSILFFAIIALLFFGCKKDWKQTTQLDISFKYDPAQQAGGLTINSLSVNIGKIKFNGKRKQGGDVVFENTPGNTSRNIWVGGERILEYDLPQGDYTQVLFDVYLTQPDTSPSMILNCTYSDSGTASQVIIRVYSQVYMQSVVRNASGGGDVQVAHGKTSSLMVTLSPGYWLQVLTDEEMEDADYNSTGSGRIIYIDKDHNADVYQQIVNRLTIPPAVMMQ